MQKVKGTVTAPKGFLANSLNCGIKKSKPDVALLISEVPAIALGVFTQNKVKAAPITISQKNIKGLRCRAIIVNSGNANCCNGPKGLKNAKRMVTATAKALKISSKQVLVASTGIIGRPLPIKLIENSIPSLVKGLRKKGGKSFTRTIMTTDKFPKEIAVKVKIGNSYVTIAGVAKGAGMINPNMATMLSFVTTDAAIKKDALNYAFKKAIDKSFNSISVDGSTSTNDCVFILANGLAKNKPISKESNSFSKFCEALGHVTSELAKMIVLDGEGATKLIHIIVKGAKNYNDAKKVASSVANDPLFKTSVYGEDPNWGRIAAAVGSSCVNLKLHKLDIYLDKSKVLSNGTRSNVNKQVLKRIYKRKNVKVVIDLKLGKECSEMLTCDLTKKYIDINAGYTT